MTKIKFFNILIYGLIVTLSIKYFDITIGNIIQETPDVKTFILEKPQGFSHLPGQFCWLTLPSLIKPGDSFPRTPMAIASGVHDNELVFSFRNWGYLTEKFFALQPGDVLSVSEPLGTAIPIDLFQTKHIICIAGGTGLTPVRSLMRSMDSNHQPELYYGAKTPSDILYKEQLLLWNSKVIVEQSNGSDDWTGDHGYVTKLLPPDLETKGNICYICGPYPMMQNAINVLKKIGFLDDQLYVSLEKMQDNEVIGPVFPVSDPNVII